ncbi:serine/threonine-protein kinase [Anaeromyxobacter sp. SG64]|uniref:protein kinase domain-containing protein n=1 Tax=Anaeromyxobacter sp. SG64 TaxID=2925409 RepID=UPI001F5845F7|nr:serine/threonine-protein kinase [Anaeromyxobacter sp. SG64]
MNRPSPTDEPRGPEQEDLTRLVGVKLGNYRLERLIGRGRMGVVYLAKDEALLRPTAIKILSWRVADAQGHDPVQWFLTEARLVARINHPRVVQIYGAARHGDHCYIAMEYVVGSSAEAVVAARGRLAPEVATDILLQAAAALEAAHRSGVIHRDVKPANLLVGDGGVTKLGDFGMALGSAELRIGTAHLRVGTPYYTAPEIWSGAAATAASDIYSLGATYFHLLTGRPPYPGPDVAAVEQGHLRERVPDVRALVPSLPASCAALLARALAKAPRERHASAQLLLWEGRRVLQDIAAAGGSPRGASPMAARPASSRAQPPAPSTAPAPRLLAEAFGFVRRPFLCGDRAGGPRGSEPFAAIRGELADAVRDEGRLLVALTGPGESGRTTLCQELARELAAERLTLVVAAAPGVDSRGLVQGICRAAGMAEEASEEACLDALVERFVEEQRRRATPLLVLDGVTAAPPCAAGVARVLEAVRWSGSFKVLLAGAPGLVEALARGGVELPEGRGPELAVPSLDPQVIGAYVRGAIDAALARGAPPIVVSPDAVLLLALRSDGVLGRVDCIAENMLVLAAAERRRVLRSWHAWVASDEERWSERATAALPRQPDRWPPPEVADVIDACRRGAGLPPWPRGRTSRT